MNVRRIVGAAAATAVATGATLLLIPTAHAGAPTAVDLSALGMTVPGSCPTPSNDVYVKPGTTIRFAADAVGLGIPLASLQVSFADPRGAVAPATSPTTYTIGAGAVPYQDITFSNAGDLPIAWSMSDRQLNLLGAVKLTPVVSLGSGNAHGTLHITPQAGQCTLAPQLPAVTVHPSLPVGGAPLPPVTLRGAQLPAVPVPNPPAVVPGVPATPGASPSGGGHSSGPVLDYTPRGPSVADRTVPKGYGSGTGAASGASATGVSSGTSSALRAGIPVANGQPAAAQDHITSGKASPGASSVDLASNTDRSLPSALPALPVILAVLALSAVTAMYARTYLLHRSPGQRAAAAG